MTASLFYRNWARGTPRARTSYSGLSDSQKIQHTEFNMKYIIFTFLILVGVFLFVYGEFDDSPGGQLIGLVAVIAGIVGIIRNKKKTSNRSV